ncbi:MAG: hypothetical protein U0L09_04935 [Christensenellales bacterium]|nr:hypothetical protein [Christensenellales bacterium]
MRIIDFDEKFFDYARTWMAMHPGMTEKQVEQQYNEIMINWLNAPAKWLDGVAPGEYFNRYDNPKDLIKLLEEYDKRDIGLPEALYSRIVCMGESCTKRLIEIASDEARSESLRATAIALLNDIGTDAPRNLYIDLVCNLRKQNELSEMAADILSLSDPTVVDELMDRFENSSEYGQELILDICCNFKGNELVYQRCVEKIKNCPEKRAYYASLLGKLGDDRAVDLLMRFLSLTELTYLDYIEIRNAIEGLGGDPGEQRTFYGDPDYEAMRNLEQR